MANNKKVVKFSKNDGSMRLSDAAAKEWKKTVDKSKKSPQGGGGSGRRKVLFH
jgi:hypothetical protein